MGGKKNTAGRPWSDGLGGPRVPTPQPAYFCQVRFLWRLARSFLRRLCLLILLLRRFFSDPIIICSSLRF
jgi:hypothetical protein